MKNLDLQGDNYKRPVILNKIRNGQNDAHSPKFGIACRNENDHIAGLFVNTDPSSSSMNRESVFQAAKTKLFADESPANEALVVDKANAYCAKNNLKKFTSAAEVINFISQQKAADASSFTRASGLQTLVPNRWHSGVKQQLMYDIQKNFIEKGGNRGAEYAITALALTNMGIGIIESSKTDEHWGVKTGNNGDVKSSGRGTNQLGSIHSIIGNEMMPLYEKALKENKKTFQYQGISISTAAVANKQNEIQKSISSKKIPLMNMERENEQISVRLAPMQATQKIFKPIYDIDSVATRAPVRQQNAKLPHKSQQKPTYEQKPISYTNTPKKTFGEALKGHPNPKGKNDMGRHTADKATPRSPILSSEDKRFAEKALDDYLSPTGKRNAGRHTVDKATPRSPILSSEDKRFAEKALDNYLSPTGKRNAGRHAADKATPRSPILSSEDKRFAEKALDNYLSPTSKSTILDMISKLISSVNETLSQYGNRKRGSDKYSNPSHNEQPPKKEVKHYSTSQALNPTPTPTPKQNRQKPRQR